MINIALTPNVNDGMISIRDTYLNSIWSAGATPILLQPNTDDNFIDRICSSSDGFVFSGGADLDPKYYGEENTQSENICSIRDEFEFKLFNAAIRTGKPILGICRGMQAINVFLGGSLYQHIEGHVQNEPRYERTHSVSVLDKTTLRNIIKDERISVNSFHHQAVRELAENLITDAVSEDGVIEAFHASNYPFLLGVQWHPESYFEYCETSRRIFTAFIDACKTSNRTKRHR